MRIPWDDSVTFDATKIKKGTGDCLYELIYQLSILDDFANFDAWTEVDGTGKVNLSGGVVSMDGANTYTTHGLIRTAAIARARGYFEIKFMLEKATSLTFSVHVNNAATLPNGNAVIGGLNFASPLSNDLTMYYGSTANIVATAMPFTVGQWYTYRQYLNVSYDGNAWRRARTTLQGGTEFTTETEIALSERITTEIAASIYFQMQRYRSDATAKIYFKEFRWYSGLATDSPTLQFDFDAGTGKKIYGLDFTNLALPADVDVTNRDYAFYYGDGTPTPSAKYTLTQLKALGAQSGNYQKLTIWEYLNSNGEAQVYGAPINADDAIDTVQGTALTVPLAPTVTGYATGKYVNLAWTMAATSVTYDIETNGVVATGYSTLSASLAMARANTDYIFRVRGVNSVGNGAWSTAITVKTENVADDETIALAGSTVLSSVEDISGEIHIAQGMTGAKIFDPMIFAAAISQETFEYYVKDIMHNTGRNVI